jgi:hypothetical protein
LEGALAREPGGDLLAKLAGIAENESLPDTLRIEALRRACALMALRIVVKRASIPSVESVFQ